MQLISNKINKFQL